MLIFFQRTCNHLEPLAIAANITQESDTQLYHVLTTLANLYCIYSNLSLPEDQEVHYEVLASLEKCWAAADQDPLLLLLFLIPSSLLTFFSTHCFNTNWAM
jgi:TRAP-type mannitol/chloroaromatic compound transport system permease small subunit